MQPPPQNETLRARLLARIASNPDEVWTPKDFADLASRAALDKTLQRLVAAGELRRIHHGLYDRPRNNSRAGHSNPPDCNAVIRAIIRRDEARLVLDGMTAAKDLGLTAEVPERIEVLANTRLRPINLGKQRIHFKFSAPSRLYWANRPAMRIVQALHWLRHRLAQEDERIRIQTTLQRILSDPSHGPAIRDDLRAGLPALPAWMQEFAQQLLQTTDTQEQPASPTPAAGQSTPSAPAPPKNPPLAEKLPSTSSAP